MLNIVRRNWLASAAFLLVAIMLMLLLLPGNTAETPEVSAGTRNALLPVSQISSTDPGNRPNVVLILTDDQPVGYEEFTPKIMEVFRQYGVRFTNAHSLTSTCCPARTTLLTGKDSPSTGVWSNWAPTGGWQAFQEGRWEGRTLASALDRRGYRTALVGKYLNGYDNEATRISLTGDSRYVPPGWDVWFASVQNEKGTGSYYNFHVISDSESETQPSLIDFGDSPEDYATDIQGKRVIEVIESTPPETPLFLMWSPAAPHAPYTASPGIRTRALKVTTPEALNDKAGKPPWIADRPPIAPKKSLALQRKQIRTLRGVDIWVDRIVKSLQAANRWENTVFIFASDNGFFRGEYGLLGMKNHPHPASTHVPLMVVAPGLAEFAGTTDNRLAALTDIPATISQATGLGSAGMDGLSLLQTESEWRSGLLIAGWRNRGGNPAGNQPSYCAWRNEEWLFIQYSANSEGEGYRELYRIDEDPSARENLAGSPDTAVAEEELAQQTRDQCNPAPPDFTWPDRVLIPVMAPGSGQ